MAERPRNPAEVSPPPLTSSIPPSLPEEAATLYREVLVAMNDDQIPYAVAGAFALAKYTGIWRMTKDLDLFIKPENVPAALESLRRHSFWCETLDPVWLSKAHRGEYFVDLISGMSNAVIMVDDSWMARTQPAVIAGVASRIICAEDLVASKLFVIRKERFDGADIAHVIYRTRGKLDWPRVLELAGEHWEILLWALILYRYVYPAHTDFVPTSLWQDLLARYLQLVGRPAVAAAFRGSLVDENMFAIDVKEWGLENLLESYRRRQLDKLAGGTTGQPGIAGEGGGGK
ncbi:MAG: nucleotidyltransferase [Acidobacteria bacterium]|nr:nucleotidyltransferase [Acidobacteriota bacterium]